MSAKALVGSATDRGQVREENQDAVGFYRSGDDRWTLLVVCDGMGGHAGGRQASAMASESIGREFTDRIAKAAPVDALTESIKAANARIVAFSEANTEFRGMGTTCVVLAVAGDEAYVAHVGDSRAYRIRPGTVEQVTTDHSYVQRMIDSGILTPEQAEAHPDANMLLRCLGGKQAVEVDIIGPEKILPGDRFLLCSDGLWGQVNSGEIAAMAAAFPAQDAVIRLISLANERGGPDNISVQIFHQSDAHPPSGEFLPEKFSVKKFGETLADSDHKKPPGLTLAGWRKNKIRLFAVVMVAVLALVWVALAVYKKDTIKPPADKTSPVAEKISDTKPDSPSETKEERKEESGAAASKKTVSDDHAVSSESGADKNPKQAEASDASSKESESSKPSKTTSKPKK